MPVTINARRLGRLLELTGKHMADESTESLNGIRLDVDATHLHLVASDRYTIAAARYRLGSDHDGTPLAHTIPSDFVQPLTAWLDAQQGHSYIEISTNTGRLVFAGPHSEMRVPVTDGTEYVDWRRILHTAAHNPAVPAPYTGLSSSLLGKWAVHEGRIRMRVVDTDKPVMIFAEDFVGAHMPLRFTGTTNSANDTFEDALSAWGWAEAPGEPVDLATAPPVDVPARRYDVTKDVGETEKNLLRQTLASTSDLVDADIDDRAAIVAHAQVGVHAWMAYRYLNALYAADPRRAAEVVTDVADQLDSGEIGEWAWDAATAAGHDPDAWHKEREAAKAKQTETARTHHGCEDD